MLSLLSSFLLFIVNGTDLFNEPAHVRVLIFARTDCPITNRYAPELTRIANEFASLDVKFWIVYPDGSETDEKITKHITEFRLPGKPTRDLDHKLKNLVKAEVSPQAAVFDKNAKLVYSGRIDNRYLTFGQSRPKASVHDLENAINATLYGTSIAEARTKAVGCYLSDLH